MKTVKVSQNLALLKALAQYRALPNTTVADMKALVDKILKSNK